MTKNIGDVRISIFNYSIFFLERAALKGIHGGALNDRKISFTQWRA